MRIPRITLLAAILQLLITTSLVLGQAIATPTRTTKAPVKIITKYITKPVTPTTGRLFVSAEPNAVVLIEPKRVRNGGEPLQGTVPAGRRDIIFNDLKPGHYRVAGALAGYKEAETEIDIAANRSDSLTLNFVQILYVATIQTNIDTGELTYGEEGKPLNRRESIRNGKVQLKLPEGTYELEITPDDPGFEALHKSIPLKQDKTFNYELTRLRSVTPLAPTWTPTVLQGWDTPPGWKADSRHHLIAKGTGLGWPRDPSVRYYQNFLLESNVKMTNDVAISFALRIRDPRNYYLLQLTGEKADEQNVLRLFLVKDGIETRLQGVQISRSKAAAMASGQFVNISIKMKDFEVTVAIVDPSTGDHFTLGALSDPGHRFAIGGVGIAARSNEENVIERFVVCPASPECKVD